MVGALWGLWAGSFTPALPVAVFYELFWLDLLAVGTYVPPNALFPLIGVLALAQNMGISDPWPMTVLVALSLPLAHLGTWVEIRHRLWQVSGYNRLLRHYRAGRSLEFVSSWALAFSLLQLFAVNFAVFFAALWGCGVLFAALVPFMPSIQAPFASWAPLWGVGAVGGLLALRTKPGFVAFGLLTGAAAVYGFIAN